MLLLNKIDRSLRKSDAYNDFKKRLTQIRLKLTEET